MKPLSNDLRRRIVEVYEEEELSYAKVAKRFHVSESSVKRFVKQWRDSGRIDPKSAANGKTTILDDAGVARLKSLVETQIDASQDELREWLASEIGVLVSQPTICRTLQRAGITRKKRRNAPQNRNGKTSKRLAKPLRRS